MSAATNAEPMPSEIPDEPLLALWSTWKLRRKAVLACPVEDGEVFQARVDLMTETEEAIIATPAETLTGVAVKLLLLGDYLSELPDIEADAAEARLLSTASLDLARLGDISPGAF